MESLAGSSTDHDSPAECHPASSSLDDGRVVVALEEYLSLRRGGQRPDRSAFLERHAAIADVLAECLEGLEFLQSAADEAAKADGAALVIETLSPSTRLGEFRIIREVGRGGMGVVYEAEQVSLGRRVALKVLPSAASLDPRQRQRFQVEAQAAALLHHPHIVPVFGVGCERGVHFYAMQFVDGHSLADMIETIQRGDAGTLRIAADAPPQETEDTVPRAKPARGDGTTAAFRAPALASTTVESGGGHPAGKARPREAPSGSSMARTRSHCRSVAAHALHAAEALEHAHGVGVLHRDIKPSNLMVDRDGHLWITDFGLARIPMDPGLTRTGDLVGTLRYMSPEQVRGDRGGIETRTDIYALGVTLYELLALKPAFVAPNHERLLQRILQEDPVPLRKLNPGIPRDLETIVLKAMSKEPAGRYGSAREMAEDLARYLDDQPILARRPNVVERWARWARRHRTVVGTAVTVLLIALTIGTLLLWQAKRRTDAALLDLREAQTSETLAFKKTFGAMDLFTLPLMKRAYEAGLLVGEDGKKLHATAARFYDEIARSLGDDDRKRELVAQAKRRSGNLHALFRDRQSIEDYDQAVRLYETIVVERPDFVWLRGDLIATLIEYQMSLETFESQGQPATFAPLDRASEVAQGLLEEMDTLATCFRAGLIVPFNDLAWRLITTGSETKPEHAQLAVRLARHAVETEPESGALWIPPPGALWNTLGAALYRVGDWQNAIAALETSMSLRNGGDPYDWYFLAMIHHRRGDQELADTWATRSREWLEVRSNRVLDPSSLERLRREADMVLREPADRAHTTVDVSGTDQRPATLPNPIQQPLPNLRLPTGPASLVEPPPRYRVPTSTNLAPQGS